MEAIMCSSQPRKAASPLAASGRKRRRENTVLEKKVKPETVIELNDNK